MNTNMLGNEKLLQLVLDHIPSYVFWKDKNSVYLGCNAKFAESAGLESSDEILGKTDFDLPWSNDESIFYRKIDKMVMTTKEAQINFEEPQTLADNSIRWLRTSKIPLLDENGDVFGILGAYEDITDKKKMELELINRNKELKKLIMKLESMNIDLEQFAFATSHDLQEPLRMMDGFIGLLEKRYASNYDNLGIEYLKHIKEGTQRMSELIGQTFAYSKIENVESLNQKTDLNLLFDELLKNLGKLIEEKKVKITVNLPTEKVFCQPKRMVTLFYNLIVNGIKFNESITPMINIDFKNRKKDWYFTVTDNGIGIDEKYHNEIFKPFKRLNNRDKYAGSGIGLSICKRIINLHEGEIWYSVNHDFGTTFHFTILKKNSD